MKNKVLYVVALLWLISAWGVMPTKGDSMLPTVPSGSLIWVMPFTSIERDDLVAFCHDGVTFAGACLGGESLLKRVVATTGQAVAFEHGILYVDGLPEKRNVDKTMLTALPYVVERDEWFVLGDNRSVSIDSRNFGPIQRQQVFGKAFVLTTVNVGGLFRALQLVTLLVLLAVFARKIYSHISS